MEVSSDEDETPVISEKEDQWVPKTELGKRVASGEITDINFILDNGYVIMEKMIVETLVPDLETDLLLIGQAKGKFGGGKKRIFRQTQKKTREGNKPRFATLAVVGNRQGIVGLGYGKSKETVPAREKAIRNAKFNLFKIRRGCGSWECGCGEPHSLPFAVEGKSGSAIIKLIPAPKGTGLKVDKEVAKILEFAGVKDVWSRTYGQSQTKINLIKAAENALKKLMKTKLQEIHYKRLSVSEGPVSKEKKEQDEFLEEIAAEKKPKKKKA
ncbi:30S ribosomal protein S5 [Candidatus Woesearchaeota archaeon]|nr:30S ribosomal protein S5 [Candidatus Woesearchaeota archaeon]